MTQPV